MDISYIMTSLRTSGGISLEYTAKQWSDIIAAKLEKLSKPYQESGKISRVGNSLILTREGKLFADGIAASFFTEEA